jgi:O-6-methylguanine DNA methyltransferase
MPETLVQFREDTTQGKDLQIHTIDPTGIIEAIDATPFQKAVWKAVVQIKPGDTVSYADLAVKIGRPRAFRAGANACGANRFAGVIPCHRVI